MDEETKCEGCGAEATIFGFSEQWGRFVHACSELCFRMIWPR
jgi:hypothetical protein